VCRMWCAQGRARLAAPYAEIAARSAFIGSVGFVGIQVATIGDTPGVAATAAQQ